MNNLQYIAYIKEKLPKDDLMRDYCESFLNTREIALKHGIKECAVKRLITLYGISRDTHTVKSFKNRTAKGKSFELLKKRITKDELYNWYVVEDHSYVDGAKHYGVSQYAFDKLCTEYEIKKDRHKTCLKSVKTREEKAGGKAAYNKQLLEKRDHNIVVTYGSIEEYNNKRSLSLKNTWEENHAAILSKVYNSKIINNSFNSSSPEERYNTYLKEKYGEENVIRQYKDNRYPFMCDFYIKSQDLFIELNLNWTHGEHPFDSKNPEDLNLLVRWEEKAKTSAFYKNAIDVWTRRDVEKQKVAKENGLNYKCYYNEIEMYE